jgi:predicted small secreted protein
MLRRTRLIFLTLALFGAAVATGACSTIEGIGKDISAAASGVKRSISN